MVAVEQSQAPGSLPHTQTTYARWHTRSTLCTSAHTHTHTYIHNVHAHPAGEFTGGSAVLEEVAKRLTLSDEEVKEKKRWGRLMKHKADFCLMAGSPTDAFEHYRWGGGVQGVFDAAMADRRGMDGSWRVGGVGGSSAYPDAVQLPHLWHQLMFFCCALLP